MEQSRTFIDGGMKAVPPSCEVRQIEPLQVKHREHTERIRA